MPDFRTTWARLLPACAQGEGSLALPCPDTIRDTQQSCEQAQRSFEMRLSSQLGSASISFGFVALSAFVLSIVFESHLFGVHDPFRNRAYLFGGAVMLMAILAMVLGIVGRRSPASKAGATAGLVIGSLAFLGSALFLFGTMLPGD
jgi:hypothetical protein